MSKKDYYRVRVCRKESKEGRSWLALIDIVNINLVKERKELIQEATELMRILGSILENEKKKK